MVIYSGCCKMAATLKTNHKIFVLGYIAYLSKPGMQISG
jgi:hypothetical protein